MSQNLLKYEHGNAEMAKYRHGHGETTNPKNF